jgi:hypothetical protein
VDDAVAIRNRAKAMEMIAREHIGATHPEGSNVQWLSLASGTAEPSLKAAIGVKGEDNVDVDLTVVDWDRRALRHVEDNARKLGYEGQITTKKMNIMVDDLSAKIAEKIGVERQYDVVENMGFEEYLPQDGDELAALKGANLPQASDFTRQAFELVKPGGVLISGNMVLNRPQIDFVFGIVDWPIINARSEESILRVYKEAGILDDPNAKVELFRVKDSHSGAHVYDIVKVTKLPEAV